jgi:uncharacterized protein YfaS (alpha-2-macroglobulin family)
MFYDATFSLGEVLKVKSELKKFNFQFKTIQQSIDVAFEGVKTYDKHVLKWERVLGTMQSADVMSADKAEKLIEAFQNGNKLKISWIHEIDRKIHHFQVDSVIRGEKEGVVKINWNGAAVNVDKKGEIPVEIPSLSNFKMTDARVVQGVNPYVLLQFSDPLLETQNIDGLIHFGSNSVSKYTIEDNEIRVYCDTRLFGEVEVKVDAGVKNIMGYAMKLKSIAMVMFEDLKPAVRLLGKGVILPSSEGLIFPFEAVNLKYVDLKIIKIYENNVSQFLQINDLDGSYEMNRVGKQILKKKMDLSASKAYDPAKWNRFYFDLSTLIKAEPGAIYQVIISFKKKYSTYKCDGETVKEEGLEKIEEDSNVDKEDDSAIRYYGYNEDYEGDEENYNWNERDNPCNAAYYSQYDRKVIRNILASNLGLIGKKGSDGSLVFAVSSLLTTDPITDATIEVYDYQKQIIGTAKTNTDGLASLKVKGVPFLMIAKKDNQRGYLKVAEGNSLSLSMFDVSGDKVQKGIKGFLYGDRGVWRPGDSLYLTFILEDKDKHLPVGHPLVFELLNPMGQITKRLIKTAAENNFYNFSTVTDANSPTGNWTAKVKVGGAEFVQRVKIETVMPNRLKLNLDFGVEKLSKTAGTKAATLTARWLHGAVAKNLKTKVDVVLAQTKTLFPKYSQYNFDDPSLTFKAEPQTILDGRLDEEGKVNVSADIDVNNAAPGMLKANFTCRVFEEGGNSSIDRFTLLYSPYKNYVGMNILGQKRSSDLIYTDTSHTVGIVTVDENGKPVSIKDMEVTVYKLNWRWWWDSNDEDFSNFMNSDSHTPVIQEKVSTVNGVGRWKFRINHPNWGRYFIRIKDPNGHSTGQMVYMDWPGWYGRSDKSEAGAASMLSFTADKDKYKVGETAKLTIPSSANGRAFISIESGTKVLKTFWCKTERGQTNFQFPITADMAPNMYVHISLLQPHGQTINDLPIRLYGIVPVQVEDPATHLAPKIVMADVLRPETKGTITVSETNGKAMTYTIAIVDEGLLDLTRFKTPEPWNTFYAREALGVKTWDIYDYVMGAFGGAVERILSVGGDEDLRGKGGTKAIRFKPMVRYLDPFSLKAGEVKKHVFDIPQYIGSVRAMVVAGDNSGAYGSTEKAVPVRKPLMILATLPRVLGPGEEVSLPVNIFAMENQVKNVSIEVTTNNMFTINGGSTRTVYFKKPGDDLATFNLKVKLMTGIGKVKVVAKSGKETSVFDVELDVRNPNQRQTQVMEAVVEPGKTWSTSYMPIGVIGSNTSVLEVSTIPPINLGERLEYLIHYPYGCIEQTTSSGFPQLYLSDLLQLSAAKKQEIEYNLRATIQRLKTFHLPSGGVSYWQGEGFENDWGTNYAGHFMIEAQKKGFTLPIGFIEGWKRYQKQQTQSWSATTNYHNDLDQAYRLYTLALAGAPELGAMNRLREYAGLRNEGRWRLAAAYQLVGQTEVCKQLIAKSTTKVEKYQELSYTYGSAERDEAMILETLLLMGDKTNASVMAKQVSKNLSTNNWISTQSTAYSLLAMGKYVGKNVLSKGLKFTYKHNVEDMQTVVTSSALSQTNLKQISLNADKVELKNTSDNILNIRFIQTGIPETGKEVAEQKNITMDVKYTTLKGETIDPTSIGQGTDFRVEVTITNPGVRGVYKEMALAQIFPSGWEIHNARMDAGADEANVSVTAAGARYQDIRDDRVYTYYDLQPRETKKFSILLNAAYIGRYYLPSVQTEAMYDATIGARSSGKWVEVKANKVQK